MTITICALGGLGEIGMNCLLLDSGREAVIIDAGIMFPDDGMFGVDYVIPDFSSLEPVKDRIRCIFLTHGHDDHIGAVHYLLQLANVPVYATNLTAELLRLRLEEHGPEYTPDIRVIERDGVVLLEDFAFEAFPVCHSISEGVGYIVRTGDGVIVHTGDFKMDDTPSDGVFTDLKRIEEVGKEGVSLLFSDSTNVENRGRTMSERYVRETLDGLMRKIPGRAIVSMFSSNIARLADTIESAAQDGRKVAVTGRSMEQNLKIARKLGYVHDGDGSLFVDIDGIGKVDDRSLAIVTTGSQGEPLSALSLMARNQHRYVKVKETDTVIISSRFIPGNEKAIFRLIDNLYRRGADVVYQAISDVHVSGHGGQKELERMARAAAPKYFVPVHGEYRQLVQHAMVAQKAVDCTPFVVENGEVLVLEGGVLRKEGVLNVGKVFVDGKGVGDVCEMVLRERKHLSRDGVAVAVVCYDAGKQKIRYGPELICVGVTDIDAGNGIIEGAENILRDVVMECGQVGGEEAVLEIRRELRRFFNRQLSRKPVIFPVWIDY
ncbi:MAG: RNase J family beta-CASP ribonuclease [Deltaproteobacteria bacterium]|nr:RNase J family beta-CASP ribonuclease [Deltaproteobacteria bacterium]NIS77522.1 RNase J family beta-CASP ribonuclease [Deltaproteobacteria bacterium]